MFTSSGTDNPYAFDPLQPGLERPWFFSRAHWSGPPAERGKPSVQDMRWVLQNRPDRTPRQQCRYRSP
jgi:hypothetical protein